MKYKIRSETEFVSLHLLYTNFLTNHKHEGEELGFYHSYFLLFIFISML